MADDGWPTDAAELQELEAALAAAPEEPQSGEWRLALFMGYCERADTAGEPADLQRAIRWGNEWLDDPSLAESERPAFTYLYMDVVWEEYQLWVRDQGDDPEALDDLVFLISARTLETGDDLASTLTRLMTGLAYLERFCETDQRADLDLGIGYLTEALALVPPETERWVRAGTALASAFRQRYLADDDRESLELAITVGEATLAWVGANDADPDILHVGLARAYKSRWRENNQPADLDRTIACWREALNVHGPHLWITAELGDNLRERAVAHEDLAELDEAIALLEAAAVEHDTDALCSLGQAHHARWDLEPAPGGLEASLGCFDRALAIGVQDGILRVGAHGNRVSAGASLLAEDRSTASRQRRNLIEAFDALMQAPGLPDGALEHYAVLLAMAELCLWGSGQRETEDIPRIRSLLDAASGSADPIPEWTMFRDLLEYVAQSNLQVGHTDATADLGVTALSRVLLSPHLDAEMQSFVRKLLPVALISRAGRMGDLRGLRIAEQALNELPEPGSADQWARRELVERVATSKIMAMSGHSWSGDMATVGKVLDEVLAEVELDEFTNPFLRMMLELFKVFAGGPAPDPRVFAPVPTMADGNAVMPAFIAVQADLAVAMRENDPAALQRCGAELITLAGMPGMHEVVRVSILAVAAYAEILLARLGPHPDAAARAAENAAAALALAGAGHHHLASTWLMWHAEALRLTSPANLPSSRESGLRALREQAWHVLAQSGTDYAVESARSAAENALVVARWCIADGDYGSAVARWMPGVG